VKLLVTGANGFIGRPLVHALVEAGHEVRALVRPASDVRTLGWGPGVEVARADLRVAPELDTLFEGIDALVHLAAATGGDDAAQFASTVVGTERLLDAMRRSDTGRLVLISSFAVYSWTEVRQRADEDTPLERDPYARDGYTVAKLWQEKLARRYAADHGWDLTVLRPGAVWGRAHESSGRLGESLGPFHLVIGPRRRLPLSYVENCASAIAAAATHPDCAGRTLNVLDADEISAWDYVGTWLRRSGTRGWRVPVPLWLARAVMFLAMATRH
jgi:nucleoside-diphosphate-sugar epimerase